MKYKSKTIKGVQCCVMGGNKICWPAMGYGGVWIELGPAFSIGKEDEALDYAVERAEDFKEFVDSL